MFHSDNNIGAEGAARMAAALERNNTLTTLDLDGMCFIIGAEGAARMAAALETNTTLTTL